MNFPLSSSFASSIQYVSLFFCELLSSGFCHCPTLIKGELSTGDSTASKNGSHVYLIWPTPFMSNAFRRIRFFLPSGVYPYFLSPRAVPLRTSGAMACFGIGESGAIVSMQARGQEFNKLGDKRSTSSTLQGSGDYFTYATRKGAQASNFGPGVQEGQYFIHLLNEGYVMSGIGRMDAVTPSKLKLPDIGNSVVPVTWWSACSRSDVAAGPRHRTTISTPSARSSTNIWGCFVFTGQIPRNHRY